MYIYIFIISAAQEYYFSLGVLFNLLFGPQKAEGDMTSEHYSEYEEELRNLLLPQKEAQSEYGVISEKLRNLLLQPQEAQSEYDFILEKLRNLLL